MSDHRLVDSFKVRAAYDMVIVGIHTNTALKLSQTKYTKGDERREQINEQIRHVGSKLAIDAMSPYDSDMMPAYVDDS